MKKISSLLLMLVAFGLTSCSFGPKELSLASPSFKGGELANLVEIVNTPAMLYKGQSNDPNAPQLLRLETQIRLKKQSAYLRNLSINDISVPSENIKVAVQDPYGKVIAELPLAQDAEESVKKLLMGNGGDVANVAFCAAYADNVDVSNLVGQAASYAGATATYPYPALHNLEGTIGRLPVRATIVEYKNGTIHGAYYYKRYGPKALLYLKGKRGDESVEINEFNNDGLRSGVFEGNLGNGGFSGIFVASVSKGSSKSLQVNLQPCPKMKSINIEEVDYGRFSVVEGTAKANALKEEMKQKELQKQLEQQF